MKYTVSLLVCVMIAIPSRGDNCAQPVVQKVQTYVAPVQKQVVQYQQQYQAPAVEIRPVYFQYLPIYGSVYQPLSQEQKDNADLVKELQSLRSEIQALKAQPIQAPQYHSPVPQGTEPLTAPQEKTAPKMPQKMSLNSGCVSCHSSKDSPTKGGEFTMFDSAGRLSLTDDQKVAAMQSVTDGKMPKGRQLTSAQKLQILSALMK